MIVCVEPLCERAAMAPRPDGTRFAMCSDHTCRALSAAFGWADRALTNTLPTSIVGGSPVRPDSLSGADPVVPPVAAIGPRQDASTATTGGAG